MAGHTGDISDPVGPVDRGERLIQSSSWDARDILSFTPTIKLNEYPATAAVHLRAARVDVGSDYAARSTWFALS